MIDSIFFLKKHTFAGGFKTRSLGIHSSIDTRLDEQVEAGVP
jgi:hypothetical protein